MKKFVIIGAGISGLVLCLSLLQLGTPVEQIEIYEKDEMPRAEGTGIIFWAEAVLLLKHLGVDLTETGVCLPNLKSIFLDGKKSEVFDIKKPTDQESYGFLRADIYNSLLKKLKEYKLEINTGFKYEKTVEKDEFCLVYFKNKEEPIATSVVIGSDGARSAVRSQILPEIALEPLYIRAYRCTYYASPEDITKLNLPTNSCYIYCGINFRVILYPNSHHNNNTSYYCFVAHRIKPQELQQRASNQVSNDEIEELIQRLPACPDSIQAILRETNLNDIIPSTTLNRLPFFQCPQKHTTLVGDAYNAMAPTAGLGFLLSITNSLFLAKSLALNTDDIPKALQQYNNSTAKHTQACMEFTTRLTDLFYIETPFQTAIDAKSIYVELSQVASSAALEALKFYQQTAQSTDTSQIAPQSLFHSKPKETNNTASKGVKPSLSNTQD